MKTISNFATALVSLIAIFVAGSASAQTTNPDGKWDYSLLVEPETALTGCVTKIVELGKPDSASAVNLTAEKSAHQIRVTGQQSGQFLLKMVCQKGATYSLTLFQSSMHSEIEQY